MHFLIPPLCFECFTVYVHYVVETFVKAPTSLLYLAMSFLSLIQKSLIFDRTVCMYVHSGLSFSVSPVPRAFLHSLISSPVLPFMVLNFSCCRIFIAGQKGKGFHGLIFCSSLLFSGGIDCNRKNNPNKLSLVNDSAGTELYGY